MMKLEVALDELAQRVVSVKREDCVFAIDGTTVSRISDAIRIAQRDTHELIFHAPMDEDDEGNLSVGSLFRHIPEKGFTGDKFRIVNQIVTLNGQDLSVEYGDAWYEPLRLCAVLKLYDTWETIGSFLTKMRETPVDAGRWILRVARRLKDDTFEISIELNLLPNVICYKIEYEQLPCRNIEQKIGWTRIDK